MDELDPVFAPVRGCFPEMDDEEFQNAIVLPITEQLFSRTVEWLFNSLPPDLGDEIMEALREGHGD